METIFRWVTKGGRRWLAPIRVSGSSTVKVEGRKTSSGSDEPIELVGEKRKIPLLIEPEFNEQEQQPIELVGEKHKLLGADEDEELR